MIRRNGKIVIEFLFRFFTGIISQAAQNILQQGRKERGPRGVRGQGTLRGSSD